ncbi:LLM class flavin-dependent oxidoreductase, partial [Frankia canadensis]|uniref:LLM class flavin-dependent oxidoreductase n=1 Tax=Frankia canadensis TaxID=1836972 RepID=UPI001054A48A
MATLPWQHEPGPPTHPPPSAPAAARLSHEEFASMEIGRIGIWSMDLERQPLAAARQAVAELDDLGFPALWIPEAMGKEVMSHAALLLTASSRIIVATGIANLWVRDATAMANAQRTLTEGFPERFLLGIGVSHAPA